MVHTASKCMDILIDKSVDLVVELQHCGISVQKVLGITK